MSKGSLEKIIGEMVARLDAVMPEDGTANALPGDPLKEIEAFMPVDPMTDVAADMLDSARSALQTRLIELQETCEQEVSDALASSLRRRRAEQEAMAARLDMEKRKKEKDSDVFFWFAVMYWIMGQTFVATRKRLSVANDFALVSVSLNEEKRAWA